MTDTPSDAAIEEALRLNPDVGYKPAGVRAAASCDRLARAILALALHLDEVDRVVRAVAELPPTDTWRDTILRALMLPDPPDPDEELAREKIMAIWSDGTPDRERVIAVFAEALREQGRLTDAVGS